MVNDGRDELPDLQDIRSSMSEETLALCASESLDFEDNTNINTLNKRVDLISTTLSPKPPKMPLREERLTLGVETIFKAKGVGWNKVRKNRKKLKRMQKKKDKSLAAGVKKCIEQNLLICCKSPIDDNTDKNMNQIHEKALTYEEYAEHLLKCSSTKRETPDTDRAFLEIEVESNQTSSAGPLSRRRIFTEQLEAVKKQSEINYKEGRIEIEIGERGAIEDDSSQCTESTQVSVICDNVVDKMIESSVAMDNNGVSKCTTPSENSTIDTSTSGVVINSAEKKRNKKKKTRRKFGLSVVEEEAITVNAFRQTSLLDAHFFAEEETIIPKVPTPRSRKGPRSPRNPRTAHLTAEKKIALSKKPSYIQRKARRGADDRASEDYRDDSLLNAELTEDERDGDSVYSDTKNFREDLLDETTPRKKLSSSEGGQGNNVSKSFGPGLALSSEKSPHMRRQLSVDLSRQIMDQYGFQGVKVNSPMNEQLSALTEGGVPRKGNDKNNYSKSGKALSAKKSPGQRRQLSLDLSRQIMEEHGFSDLLGNKKDPEAYMEQKKSFKATNRPKVIPKSPTHSFSNLTGNKKDPEAYTERKESFKSTNRPKVLPNSPTPTFKSIDSELSLVAPTSPTPTESSFMSFDTCRSNGTKPNREEALRPTSPSPTENSFMSYENLAGKEAEKRAAIDIPELDFDEVMSFPTFSMNSCESLSDNEHESTEENKAARTSRLPGSKDEIKAKEEKPHQKPDLVPSESISKSFSFQTCTSDFLSIKSVASQMSSEEVEHAVSYTVGELGRIKSLLDSAVSADSLSYNSSGTDCRDALYFATQSKREIAALAQTLERQIFEVKDSPKFDSAPSRDTTDNEGDDGLAIGASLSFGSLRSTRSKATSTVISTTSMDKLILEVNELCNKIEGRIDNIVKDSNNQR